MLKKVMKGLLSVVLIIVMGVLSVIEIGIELIYQIVRLIKRGYGYLTESILKTIEPIYKGRLTFKTTKDETDEIKFYTFKY